ncbi:hypothetical protein GCM10026987_23750 [Belliella aquatica]|uniref:DUF3953 domain-containing protein n=1 Tax=Belliella aquatica TaxID=1323734 RepID=A0ABQ1MLT4_9BACT|nr:hypothetical protein GCM10010993_19760 [Belliella aquatica]
MKLNKSLSALTFILILFYISLRERITESIFIQSTFLGCILFVAIAALIFKNKEHLIKKSEIIVLGFSILGSFLIMFYFFWV